MVTQTYHDIQGVHYILCFLKYSGLLPFSPFPRSQCVYIHQAGKIPALQQNWQGSEKSQNFKENTIFNEHPVQPTFDSDKHDFKTRI